MNRRNFVISCAAAGLVSRARLYSQPARIHYRNPPPYEPWVPLIESGHDEFPEEKAAMELAASLRKWWAAQRQPGLARFYVLPNDLVRVEIKSTNTYKTGLWRVQHSSNKVSGVTVIEEHVASVPRPYFRDVTATAFRGVPSFADQLSRGIPYWMARLDPALGIDPYGNQGIAVGDIDRDGWDEVFVCQPGGLPNRLYKNVNGQFQDISARAGVDILDETASALFLDLRNTGLEDLLVLRSGGPVLFLNRGDGTFQLRGDAFRFATPLQGTFTGMAAADYDRDGKLDLYLCSYFFFQSEAQYRYPVPYYDAQNGPPNYLFRNNLAHDGTGSFEDVTAESGLNENNNRFSFAAAWCDYNGDGWPDLCVANDFGRKNLYRNDRGKFRDVAPEAGVEDIGPGMSVSWFDFDGDGRPDLYFSNMWSDAGQRIVNSSAFTSAKGSSEADAYRRHAKGNSLYKNVGPGPFQDVSAEQGIEMGRWAWASDAHDFDCDGSPEIFIACGMMTNQLQPDLASFFWRQVVAKSPAQAKSAVAYEAGWNALNQFFREGYSWNGNEPNVFLVRKDGRYRDFSGVSGLDTAEDGRAFAVTDLTGDGTLDLILKNRLGPQVRVFVNQCAGDRNRLVLRLVGTKSNRDAIGARVQVDSQTKWIFAGSGYLSQHTRKLHFGLGSNPAASVVRITWPSGYEQMVGKLEAGFEYRIEEGSSELHRTPLEKRRHFGDHNTEINADNRPRLEDTWFWEPIPLPDPRPGPGLLTITDQEPPDTLAAYSIFRRYLFEWRCELDLPLHLLLDDQGRARKIYATPPSKSQLQSDLATIRRPVPLSGYYLVPPHRDFFKIGAALVWSGYPEQALPYLKATLQRSPQSARTMVLIARIHLSGKRPQPAREMLEAAIRIEPTLAEAWNELGGVEAIEGSTTRALENYTKAIELQPDNLYATLNAAQACADLEDNFRAEQLFRRASELDSGSAEAANGLGLALAKQGRKSEAKIAFERAITLRRDFASAINNLGVLYINDNDLKNAVAAFRYGVQVAPEDETLNLNLAKALLDSGAREQARQVVQSWVARNPQNQTALRALHALDDSSPAK